jgi:hypothetical protein
LVYSNPIGTQQLEERENIDRTVIGLAEEMARTLSYIEDVEQFARLHQLKKALEEVIPLMDDTTNFIIKYTNRTLKGRRDFHDMYSQLC